MDNLTHTLVGVALAQSGLKRLSPGALGTLVVASNLPDIDLLFAVRGATSYLEHHRDLTHSIVGAPALALLLAGGASLGVRGARFLGLLLASLAGVASHVFLDLWTSYGTRVLSPFDRTFYAWDLVFIIDPVILLVLALSIVAARGRVSGARIASLGLGLVLAYGGARAVLHSRAMDEARSRLPDGTARRLVVLPSPLDPLSWRVLADTGESYWLGTLRLSGPTAPFERRVKRPEDALVARVREESEVAQVFLAFSTFPWLEVEREGDTTAVTWRDLRFEEHGRRSFVARVLLDGGGRIKSEDFRF